MAELKALRFGTRSREEIIAASAFTLVSNKIGAAHDYGTVSDPRSGATKSARCDTCRMTEIECPGHFGHMLIDSPIVHPLFVNVALSVLRVVCARCHRLVFNELRLSYENMENVVGARRIERISDLIGPRGVACFHCGTHTVQYVMADHNPKPGSNAPASSFIHRRTESQALGTVDTYMPDDEVARILEDIPDEDVKLLGMAPTRLMVRAWPVIPLRCTKQAENGSWTDDLVTLLRDMVKYNAIASDEEQPDLVRVVAQIDLREKLYTYVSNSENRKSSNMDRGTTIDGIIDRIKGKHGLIRNNLMGKRSVMTARTVIGPDPTTRVNEVGFSREIASQITVPVTVIQSNLQECRNLVAGGRVRHVERDGHTFAVGHSVTIEVGDIVVPYIGERTTATAKNLQLCRRALEGGAVQSVERDGKPLPTPNFEIKVGDKITRTLQDGDWVMMNRHPTLHRGSMITFRARLRNTKTFGLNVAVTKSFNADFDGDQMNSMIPQSIKARVELAELSSVYSNMIIGSRANICIVQDGLTGVYLMSMETDMVLPQEVMHDIVYAMMGDEEPCGVQDGIRRVNEFRERLGKKTYDPRMLVSLAFPDDFCYERDDMRIENSLILEGLLTKKYLGANGSSFLKPIMFRYGAEACGRFIDRLQFAAIAYLSWRGFSVYADDFCHAGEEVCTTVQETLEKAQEVSETIQSKRLRAAKVREVLNMAKDVGMIVSKRGAPNLSVMIESGSKGDIFNVGQIRGTLGQQNLDGGVIEHQMNGGRRSTIHYHINEKDPKKLFESRGFIASSFARGLTPREILFHAMTGREGVCTSATLTAVSGYTARRVNKFCEDMVVRGDGSIGDTEKVYDFAYGGTGMSNAFINMDFSHAITSFGGEPAKKKRKLE